MLDILELFNKEYNTLKKRLIPVVVQIGVGGTGSNLSQQVAQMLRNYPTSSHYVLSDPDQVEEKNLNNQLFTKGNINKPKAEVLAKRYSSAYQIPVYSYTDSFIESVEDITKLFNTGDFSNITYQDAILPILIGCVDNHYSRQIMHEFYKSNGTIIYIDSGNETAVVPEDFPSREMKDWTESEKENYHSSGWTGQVVCGMKIRGKQFLEPVAEVYPDILEEKDSIAPSTLSCEELSSSDPQRLLTNRMASMAMSSFLSEIIESKTISKRHTVFHAKKIFMQSELLQ